MALLQADKVVFYNPLNSASGGWSGTGSFGSGQLGNALNPDRNSTYTFGSNSPSIFDALTSMPSIAMLDSETILVLFADATTPSPYEGYLVVGKVSGDQITFGPRKLYDTATQAWGVTGSLAGLSSTSAVVVYGDPSKAKAVVISGLDITVGSSYALPGTSPWYTYRGATRLSSSTAFIAYFTYTGGGYKANGVVATVGGGGLTLTYGTGGMIGGVNYPGTGNELCAIALSSSAVVINSRTSTGRSLVWIAIISGTTTTFGPLFEWNTDTSSAYVGLAVADSTTIVVATQQWADNKVISKVGKVSGTDITFGALAVIATPAHSGNYIPMATLDATHIATFISEPMEHRIGTISGSSISWSSATTNSQSNELSPGMVAMNSGKVVMVFRIDNGSTIRKIITYTASIDFKAEQTATGTFPTAVAATRATYLFWGKNPTKSMATVTLERGYVATLSAFKITLGGTTAEWTTGISTMMNAINNGASHMVVLDFEHQGGTNWKLRTSVDGAAWVDRGTQDTGSQGLLATNTVPKVALNNPASEASGQFVDEAAMWVNADLFTTGQLQNLYDLNQVFGDGLDQYEQNFGAPLCWQATGRMPDGSVWRDAGSGACPHSIRVPNGVTDLIVTDDGKPANPIIVS